MLPSGARRVRVYAGIDPLTGRRHYLTEVVPAGSKADKEAEKSRTRRAPLGSISTEPRARFRRPWSEATD